jgi:hypothetical protein
MDRETIDKISKKIHKRFPQVAGAKPKVRKQSTVNSKSKAKSKANSNSTYLVTFHSKGKGPNGVTIPFWVRVVANADGKIIKTTTSR